MPQRDWSWKPDKVPAAQKNHPKRKKLARPHRRWKSADPFFSSEEWLRLRYTVLKKYGAMCQCCGATRADGAQMQVDHVKPRSKFPELALCEDNLQVLCSRCNYGKGAWDQTDWREMEEAARQHMRDIR